MSIGVKLHQGEIFKDKHLNIVLVLQNLLFRESNDVLSIEKCAIFSFTIECLVLTNHIKFQILKIKFVILINI
jgi:hypothetical protein